MENSDMVEEKIFEYVRKNTHSDINKITPDTLLFREGIFDSMGFVLLIDFIEENFGVKATDSDLVEENFESIAAIKNYIQKKNIA
jgi:acyl carrier protein